ncbi:MAG: ECF transporter S component [Defluviitaleaceae bacterium]|nr:ECF transporter S component [Defluviitaleaceae bacterium]
MTFGRTKYLTTMGMLAAMAVLSTILIRIPVMPAAPFLTYDPKDIIVVIGGFIFGPVAALTLAVVSALVEMPFSGTGPWGVVMNISSSAAFAVPAAIIYKYRRTMTGAITGLVAGVLIVVPVMLALNYLIMPIYTGMPRAAIVAMLRPTILPFNVIKYSLSAAITLMIYRPIVTALAASGLLPASTGDNQKRTFTGILIIAALIAVGLIMTIIIMNIRA